MIVQLWQLVFPEPLVLQKHYKLHSKGLISNFYYARRTRGVTTHAVCDAVCDPMFDAVCNAVCNAACDAVCVASCVAVSDAVCYAVCDPTFNAVCAAACEPKILKNFKILPVCVCHKESCHSCYCSHFCWRLEIMLELSPSSKGQKHICVSVSSTTWWSSQWK